MVKSAKSYFVILLTLFVVKTAALAAQDQHIRKRLAELQNIHGRFSFVVIGDNRSGDDIYRKIAAAAMKQKPAFIVNTGDMIEKPGSKKDWEKFWDLSKPVIVPYFLTVGNHDAHPRVPRSEKTYKEQVDLPGNELYYSFGAGNSLFIVLDSFVGGREKRIAGEQLNWLEDVLANAKERHKFVFLHHPLYTDPGKGHHAHDSLDKYPVQRDALQALFVKYRVDAVFAGHEHYYEKRRMDGVLHVITGGGGAPIYDGEQYGGFNHFVLVTVDGDKVNGEVVDVSGNVRDRF